MPPAATAHDALAPAPPKAPPPPLNDHPPLLLELPNEEEDEDDAKPPSLEEVAALPYARNQESTFEPRASAMRYGYQSSRSCGFGVASWARK